MDRAVPERKFRPVAAIAVAAAIAVVGFLVGRQDELVVETAPDAARTSGAKRENVATSAAIAASAPPMVASVVPTPSGEAAGVPVHAAVRAPGIVAVGEPFDARVQVEAPGGVRRLAFAVRYDRKRVRLLEASEGDFARYGAPTELSTDEPSDGNVQVSLVARDDRWVAGEGIAIVLRFEAIASGTTTITVRDFTAVDSGARRSPVAVRHDSTIAIR